MVLYRTSGEVHDFPPSSGDYYSLEELQAAVGGLIELVRVDPQQVLVVNEEGHLLGLPVNEAASITTGTLIVGDSVLCSPESIE